MRRGFGGRRGGPGFGGMFRGRGLMRPRMARNPLARHAQQQLMRANQLIMAGQAVEAAAIFASIALMARENGMPGRSANLSARAALAYFEANDIENGKAYALKAVRESIAVGDLGQAVRIARQTIAQLKSRGLDQEAEALKSQFDALLGPHGISLADGAAVPPAAPKKLPPQCPACLGPVRPDAVEWIDEETAECAYCGSMLQAE